MTLDRGLTWFINVWIGLIILLNVFGIFGFIYTAPTFWVGIDQVRDTYSPFNIGNWVIEIVSLSPALGVMYWRDRRRGNGRKSG